MDVRRSNSVHRIQSMELCTRCMSYLSVISVSGVIFVLCFSCSAAVLECSCATGCNFRNVCDTWQSCERRNMALGRPATISSLFDNTQYNQTSGPACLAVNGNISTGFSPINKYPDSPNCVHTADNNDPAYWEVDLGQPYDIHFITVYARESQNHRLVTAIVMVDNKTCFNISTTSIFHSNKADIKCWTPQRGQRIQIYKESRFLMFCEVQVWVACGNVGSSNQRCAYCGHCKDNTDCDHASRNCTQGCDPGWTGIECDDECSAGTYGAGCNETCGNCIANSTCNIYDGRCETGCAAGYIPPLCKEACKAGTYGANCHETCGSCRDNSQCNIYDGSCETGCAAGYKPPLCKVCSPTCDTDHESANTAGPIAGAVVGSVACGLIGFLVGVLFMRHRHRQRPDINSSAACFSVPLQTVHIPHPTGVRSTEPAFSSDYEDANVSTSLYDSLKESRDDNTASDYTSLSV